MGGLAPTGGDDLSSGGSERGKGGGLVTGSSVKIWVCLGGGLIAGLGGRAGFGVLSCDTCRGIGSEAR